MWHLGVVWHRCCRQTSGVARWDESWSRESVSNDVMIQRRAVNYYSQDALEITVATGRGEGKLRLEG